MSSFGPSALIGKAKWKLPEVAALVHGVKRFGLGRWGLIKKHAPELRNRSVKDLESKWMLVGSARGFSDDVSGTRNARVIVKQNVLDDRKVSALPRWVKQEYYAICWGNFHGTFWPCCILDPRDTGGELREMAMKGLGRSHLVVWLGTHDFSTVKFRYISRRPAKERLAKPALIQGWTRDLCGFEREKKPPKKMTNQLQRDYARAIAEAKEQLQLPPSQRMLHLWRNTKP
eukprot:scaffold7780_cov267-Pinguiococcus_pyrenoidosus.AAC.3